MNALEEAARNGPRKSSVQAHPNPTIRRSHYIARKPHVAATPVLPFSRNPRIESTVVVKGQWWEKAEMILRMRAAGEKVSLSNLPRLLNGESACVASPEAQQAPISPAARLTVESLNFTRKSKRDRKFKDGLNHSSRAWNTLYMIGFFLGALSTAGLLLYLALTWILT